MQYLDPQELFSLVPRLRDAGNLEILGKTSLEQLNYDAGALL
jgi:hypothetical protein